VVKQGAIIKPQQARTNEKNSPSKLSHARTAHPLCAKIQNAGLLFFRGLPRSNLGPALRAVHDKERRPPSRGKPKKYENHNPPELFEPPKSLKNNPSQPFEPKAVLSYAPCEKPPSLNNPLVPSKKNLLYEQKLRTPYTGKCEGKKGKPQPAVIMNYELKSFKGPTKKPPRSNLM